MIMAYIFSGALGVTGDVTPISQAITLSAIGAVVTIATIVLGNRNRAKVAEVLRKQHSEDEARRVAEKAADRAAQIEKEERDYARQDLVQQRIDRASRRNLRQMASVERIGKVTLALVNSDKTAAMKEKLESTRTELVLMKEIIELKKLSGIQPSPESLAFMEAKRHQISALDKAIEARLAEQHFVENANLEADAAARMADAAADAADAAADAADDVADAVAENAARIAEILADEADAVAENNDQI